MTVTRSHRLPVRSVEEIAEDGFAIVLDVPDRLAEDYRFQAGQHLTVLCEDGVRRSFSIAAAPSTAMLRIGVRRLPGGAFSDSVLARLQPGAELEVMTPSGRFVARPDPAREASYVAIAAGSGITPVLSIVSALLEEEPRSVVTLIVADRTARSAMFLDELHDLKDRHLSRMQLVHVLSREQQEAELLSGRLDGERLRRVLDAFVDVGSVDDWFLCGPHGMVLELGETLRGLGVTRLHTELFHVPEEGTPAGERAAGAGVVARAGAAAGASVLQLSLDGRSTTTGVASGETLLEAALHVRPDLPYACRGGVCGTCRAHLVEGTVEMAANYALEPDEVAAGYVLTCQSRATSPTVRVDFDR